MANISLNWVVSAARHSQEGDFRINAHHKPADD